MHMTLGEWILRAWSDELLRLTSEEPEVIDGTDMMYCPARSAELKALKPTLTGEGKLFG